ncbi:MAG: hypothetical protein R8J85_03895 [Mariprofundales bacterium]
MVRVATDQPATLPLSARLLFGVGLLLSAITASNYTQAVVTLLIATLTTMALNQLALLWRALRYLRWLLLPVIVLHLTFTPGMLLAPDLPWSPTQEGANAAMWQSLRLINWFLSGWLLAYLLSHQEWQQLFAHLPKVGQSWSALLIALPPMVQRCQQSLTEICWRWRLERGGWRDIPPLATAMVVMVLAQGSAQAEAHWLTNRRATLPHPTSPPPPFAWLPMVLVGAGWATLWSIW